MNYCEKLKTIWTICLLAFMLVPVFGQTPEVVSLRELTLKEGSSPYAFQNLMKINSQEMADKSRGMHSWLMIADRGERKGKYLHVYGFEYKAVRDHYFPTEDAESYPRMEALEKVMNTPDVDLSERADGFSTYTDYVQLDFHKLVNQKGGNVISLRKVDVPKENQAAFEKLIIEEYQPYFQKNVDGLSAYVMKGDRGERKGQYILVWAFQNMNVRDMYFPEEGKDASEAWKKATENSPNLNDKIEKLGAKTIGTYTDYVIMM